MAHNTFYMTHVIWVSMSDSLIHMDSIAHFWITKFWWHRCCLFWEITCGAIIDFRGNHLIKMTPKFWVTVTSILMNSFKSKPELRAVRVTRINWTWIRTGVWTWVWWVIRARDKSWCCQNRRFVTWLHAEGLLLRGNWTWIFSWVIFGKPVIYFFFISFNLIFYITSASVWWWIGRTNKLRFHFSSSGPKLTYDHRYNSRL